MNRPGLLPWVLRAAGVTEILAFGAVVMPRGWMQAAHQWLGMGTLPEAPVLDFMIRQASFCYGLHGIALLIIAADPARYRPLVWFTAIGYALAGPVFVLIDLSSGMPLWWIIADGGGCFVLGLVIWCLLPSRSDEATVDVVA
jgi:hypothetical protein